MNHKTVHLFRHSVIKARVDGCTRTCFRNIARSAGKIESEFLREIISLVIDRQIPREPEPVVPVSVHSHTAKLTVRLPSFLLDAAKERAKMQGMSASRWTASLIQSNLLKIPVMTTEELRVLGYRTSELSAIGRSLNQVARALNTDMREADKLKLELLEAVQLSVRETQNAIRILARAANQRWEYL